MEIAVSKHMKKHFAKDYARWNKPDNLTVFRFLKNFNHFECLLC